MTLMVPSPHREGRISHLLWKYNPLTHCFLCAHQSIHFIVAAYQVDWRGLPFSKSMLTTPCFSFMYLYAFQKDIPNHFPRDSSEMDLPVILSFFSPPKSRATFSLFQSSETFHVYHNYSKIIEKNLTMTLACSLGTRGCNTSRSVELCGFFKDSLSS